MKTIKQVRAYIRRIHGKKCIVRKHRQRYTKRMIAIHEAPRVIKLAGSASGKYSPKPIMFGSEQGEHEVIPIRSTISNQQLMKDISMFPAGTEVERIKGIRSGVDALVIKTGAGSSSSFISSKMARGESGGRTLSRSMMFKKRHKKGAR